jgi:hypothetical protein
VLLELQVFEDYLYSVPVSCGLRLHFYRQRTLTGLFSDGHLVGVLLFDIDATYNFAHREVVWQEALTHAREHFR